MLTEDLQTTRTLRNIKKTLKENLSKKYNIEDDEVLDSMLEIHGLHKNNFDFLNNINDLMMNSLNDVSIDDNSNKNEKTIEGIMQEAMAPAKKAIGYDYLYRKMKELYGQKDAKFLSGEMLDLSLGLSDSTNILKIYCWALDASKIVMLGRPFGQLHSGPTKRVESYVSALCETIHQMSSHLAGAIAIGSFFLDIGHLCLFKEKIDLRELKTNKHFRKKLETEFQQFVHSVNHLSRSGAESPFTNVSIFDRVKLRALLKDMAHYFPFDELPINKPSGIYDEEELKDFYLDYIVDYIIEIQDVFLDFFDKGDPIKNGLPYRFPVVTINFSKKQWGDKLIIEDQQMLHDVCKRDIYRYNIFASEGTKVCSCCFEGDELITLVEDENKEMISIKDFVEQFSKQDEFEMKIDKEIIISSLNPKTLVNENVKITGVLKKKNTSGKLIKVCVGKKTLKVTPDHTFLVKHIESGKIIEIEAQDLISNFKEYQLPID